MSKLPYVGLRSFQREEANVFLGRKHHVDDLLTLAAQQHFLAVVGTSGSGKSSFVHAGLIPCLLGGALAKSNGRGWHIVEMTPDDSPFANLAAALRAEGALGADFETLPFEPELLKNNVHSLHELLAKHPLSSNGQLLIVCDQFEDLFRHPNAESADFVKLLIASSETHKLVSGTLSNAITVLIVLRADFLSDCNVYPELSTLVNKGIYHLPPLNHEQLKIAIEQPAVLFGGAVESDLVKQLLTDAEHNDDQLPLIQHTLLNLWTKSSDRKLKLFDYHALGGLKRILSNHADQIYLSLTNEQQKIARYLFKGLIEPTKKHRTIALPIKLSEVAALANVNWLGVAAVVEAFRQVGQEFLLPALPVPLSPNTLLDVAHDSVIRQWQRLNEWVAEEVQASEYYMRLNELALYNQNNPDASEVLVSSPELDMLWQWYDDTKPTAAWAKRYGGDFESAMALLQKSKKTADFKKNSLLAGGAAIMLLAATIGFVLRSPEEPANKTVTPSAKVEPTTTVKIPKPKSSPVAKAAAIIEDKPKPVPPIADAIKVEKVEVIPPPVKIPEVIASTSKPAVTTQSISKDALAEIVKRFPDKVQLLQEYKKINLTDVAAWDKLADFFRLQTETGSDNKELAITAYLKVVELKPDSKWAYFRLGELYDKQKQWDKAVENYQKQLKINPGHEFAWQYLADTYQKQNKYPDAVAAFKQALKIKPNNETVKKQLQAAEKKLKE